MLAATSHAPSSVSFHFFCQGLGQPNKKRRHERVQFLPLRHERVQFLPLRVALVDVAILLLFLSSLFVLVLRPVQDLAQLAILFHDNHEIL